MVGKFGKDFANFNIGYFGYLAYIDMFALLYPVYRIYRDSNFTQKRYESVLSIILLVITVLIFQALLVGDVYSQGVIGQNIVYFLKPFIGSFGVWLFWLILTTMALFILFDFNLNKKVDNIQDFLDSKDEQISNKLESVLKKSIIPTPDIQLPQKEDNQKENNTKHISNNNIVDDTEKTLKDESDIKIHSHNEDFDDFVPDLSYDDIDIKVKKISTKSAESTQNIIDNKEENDIKKDTQNIEEQPKNELNDKIVKNEVQIKESEIIVEEIVEYKEEDPKVVDNKEKYSITETTSTTSIDDSKSQNIIDNMQKPEAPTIKEQPKIEPLVEEVKEIKDEQPKEVAKEIVKENKPQELDLKPIEPIVVVRKEEAKNTRIVSELEENTKLLESLEMGIQEKPDDFELPRLEFLQQGKQEIEAIDETIFDEKIANLIHKLDQFKVTGDVVRTYAGPVVTTFEFKPAANVKVSKILNLADDLAMALKAQTIRIQAPIPGKDVVGIEIPNDEIDTIYLRDLLESDIFRNAKSPLTIALGKDIVGKPFVTDLKKLPHLLIAGTTGSGKSVGINAMILSLLYRNSPDNLKLLMIDPKMLEFSIYNDIPHLLTPVITKPKQAIAALNNMVLEMERRYELLSESRTKNIDNYNEKAKKHNWDELPFIVIVIDELADLMMTSGKDVEYSIGRLAQMARASGIHLIVATQRPSVDVVTGLIKANLPSRLSYRVGQKIDSKVILDALGAESLLGRGDMLFTPPGSTGLVRLHAPWSTEDEIEQIVEFLKDQREAQYDPSFLAEDDREFLSANGGLIDKADLDELFEDAKRIVLAEKKTSISYLQRRLQIGYNRSARIIEQLQDQGVLSEPNAKGNREILI